MWWKDDKVSTAVPTWESIDRIRSRVFIWRSSTMVGRRDWCSDQNVFQLRFCPFQFSSWSVLCRSSSNVDIVYLDLRQAMQSLLKRPVRPIPIYTDLYSLHHLNAYLQRRLTSIENKTIFTSSPIDLSSKCPSSLSSSSAINAHSGMCQFFDRKYLT